VVAAGIMFWALFSSYAAATEIEQSEKLNENMLVLRSMVSADYVTYPDNIAVLRNIGSEPVVVFRMIVRVNGTEVWDSGISNLGKINVGELRAFRFLCPGCFAHENEPVILEVFYMPEELFNRVNPASLKPTSKVILFRVNSFPIENLKLKITRGVCETPQGNWTWVDFMDPFEASGTEGTLTQWIRLRFPEASSNSTIKIKIGVNNLVENDVITVYKVSQWVQADTNNRKYPVTIKIIPESPNWSIPQREWYLGAYKWHGSVRAYVDFVKLFWSRFNYRVYQAFVKVFHRESGTYLITVRLVCKTDSGSRVVAEGSLIRDVSLGWGSGAYEDYIVKLSPHPSMLYGFNRVEVYVTKLS